jgi:hypothetical protein
MALPANRRRAAADGVMLAVSPSGTIKATGNELAVTRWLPILRENKPALVEVFTQASNEPRSAPSVAPVVQLRLILQQDDGTRAEAILAIPKARDDGMRVLELFEQHRMAGTTRVISVLELDECPETIGR